MDNAYLILEDGTLFRGRSIGSRREVISEVVFNTSMTGYLEVLTDPSYAGQALVMTYPLIGNYGISIEDMESSRACRMHLSSGNSPASLPTSVRKIRSGIFCSAMTSPASAGSIHAHSPGSSVKKGP